MSCSKTAKTYPAQLEILKSRGLLVPDEARALHCLEHHNYYRLSAYRFPLKAHIFTLRPDFHPLMGFPADWQKLPLWAEPSAAEVTP